MSSKNRQISLRGKIKGDLMVDIKTLEERQSFLLDKKIEMSYDRIKEWYEAWDGQVYVSFSGGKDSTVLLDLVRSVYPNVPAVFIDTGLEYPEIRQFVKTINNVIWLKPEIPFPQVIEKYGYPVISKEVAQKISEVQNTRSKKLYNKRLYGDEKGNGKLPTKWQFLIDAPFKVSHKCCYALKKNPVKKYEKKEQKAPFVATMVSDSRLRRTNYLKYGCNSFDGVRPMSLPLSFWAEEDVWKYITRYKLPYSSIYDLGYLNTGCMFCSFGTHLEKQPNKFQQMKETHPKQWNYCINKLGIGKVLDYIEVPYR